MGSDGAARSVGSRLSGISIHAPRMGSDDVLAQADPAIDPISIHAPRMGSDPDTTTPAAVHDTISIHAPRMGSDPCRSGCRNYDAISIHAPRMGSDSPSALPKSGFSHFNPRSPDGERLPVSRFAMPSPSNFNPRSPDGERLTNGGIHCLRLKISIHAPRMGSDLWRGSTTRPRMRFQSTLPGWGATFRAFLFGLWG